MLFQVCKLIINGFQPFLDFCFFSGQFLLLFI